MARTPDELLAEAEELRRLVNGAAPAPLGDGPRTFLEPAEEELLHALQDGIMVLDMSGTFVFMNLALEGFMAQPRERLLGTSVFDLMPHIAGAEELEKLVGVVRAAFLEGQTPPVEYDHLRGDGSSIRLGCTASYLRDRDGKPRALVVSYRDQSERVRAERGLREREERFRALFEGARDAVFLADVETGAIVDANPAASELLLMPRESLVGLPFLRLLPRGQWSEAIRHFQDAVEERSPRLPQVASVLRSDGAEKQVEVMSQVIPVEGKRVFYCVIHDLTVRVLAEQAHRESVEVFRTLADQSPSMIFINQRGRVVYVNRKCEETMGYSRQEFLAPVFDFWCLVAPEFREAVAGYFQLHAQGVEVPPYEYAILKKDGEKLVVIQSTRLITYQGDVAVLGIITDITERKRAEDALRESEAMFRILADQSPSMIFINQSGRVTYVNRKAEEVMGYSLEEFLTPGFDFLCLHAPGSRELAWANFQRHQRGEGVPPQEYTLVSRSGAQVVVLQSTSLIQYRGGQAILGVATDITERKRAEEVLRESEDRLRSLSENLAEGMVYQINSGSDGSRRDFTYLSPPGLARLHELQAEEARRDPSLLYRQVVEADRAMLAEREARAYATRTPLDVDLRVRLPSGQVRWRRFVSAPRALANGTVAWDGIELDITERKRAEEVLRESEEMYRTLVQTSPDAIMVLDRQGRITEVSQQAVEQHGFGSIEEMLGRNILELVHPDDREWALQYRREVLAKGSIRTVEYTLLRKDGSSYVGEVNASLVRDAHGRPKSLIAAARDVTRRKLVEAELAQVQRLESLGVLAGGIAHDFNNLLSAISLNLSTARAFGSQAQDIQRMLADAETATLRARSLTQQLLTFSKGGLPIKKPLSLGRLLRETAEFALSGSGARCEFSLPGELWPVEADDGLIGQAVQNLVINADQAMPGGGVVRLAACNLTVGRKGRLPLKEGKYVKVTVADQGVGIPEENLPRVFDPFFTTKHKGSGLGLATCFSIVKRHDGHIEVWSEPGVGTTFTLYLPALGRSPEVRAEEKPGPFRGQGRVLVVDDDEAILRAAGEAIKRMGFSVQVADDGQEGVTLYQQAMAAGEPFDAVILDLTIPGGMGGKEAVEVLLRLDPKARVIVSSGYADNPVMARYREFGFSGAMAKPYRLEEMGEVLRRVLEGD